MEESRYPKAVISVEKGKEKSMIQEMQKSMKPELRTIPKHGDDKKSKL